MKNIELTKPVHFNKAFAFEIKEAGNKEDNFFIKGYASTFDTVDRANDKMVKGCFKKSLESNNGQWPVKFEHKDIIGMNLMAKEDKKGLYVESDLFNDSDLMKVKEVIALIKNCKKYKHKLGLSVGGVLKSYGPVIENGSVVWEIKEFDVLEHSITGTPANPEAHIKSLDSILRKEYDAACNNLEKEFDFKKTFDKNLIKINNLLSEDTHE